MDDPSFSERSQVQVLLRPPSARWCVEPRYREFNAHNATAAALLSLGRLRHATDEYDQAGNLFNECLDIARQHRFPLLEARIQLRIGALLKSRGNENEAGTAILRARIIFSQLNLPELSET